MLGTIMLLLFGVQVSSVIYCIVKSKVPLETHYGFGAWGCIPIIILYFIDKV